MYSERMYNISNSSYRASVISHYMRNLIGLLFFRGYFTVSDVKPFKSFKEQLEILKERGLVIEDETKVLDTLKHINYYRISGYTLTFRHDDIFYLGISFDDIMQLYYFDCELRTQLLYLLDFLEISFRTHIAYYQAQKYGSIGYLDFYGFENSTYHQHFVDELSNILHADKATNEIFVKHHREVYEDKFPIWVAVELISFGLLSRLYSNSEYTVRKHIANEIYHLPPDYIQNWLRGLVIIRNICAHRGRLYNRPIAIKPKLSSKDKHLGLKNDRAFIYIFILKKLIIDKEVWRTFFYQLEKMTLKYPVVKLDYLGFPENWRELLKPE